MTKTMSKKRILAAIISEWGAVAVSREYTCVIRSLLLIILLASAGCQMFHQSASGVKRDDPSVAKVEQFRELVRAGNYEAARGMMTEDPRRWFRQREGAGRAWRIGPGKKGPWAAWDEHMRSQTEHLRWETGDGYARSVFRETNDYFRLLERGWVTTTSTYFFDSAGKIEGKLIAAAGERHPGRTDDFVAWAKANDPAEFDYLEPGGEIDPSGDRPQRYRTLLNRWRKAAGLPPIE